jgi:hypothetical protein
MTLVVSSISASDNSYSLQCFVLIALAFFVALFPIPSQAELQKFTATHTYVMGDRDSKDEARTICYIAAKRKLLEKVGVLVESSSEVQHLQVTKDQINSYSAGILSIEVIKEEYSTTRGITSLTMSVQATADIAEVRKGLTQALLNGVGNAKATTPKIDLTPLIGTVEVSFQPLQTAGVRNGCSLVYRAIGPDHAYRRGSLVSLVGNIAYLVSKEKNNAVFSLKLGTLDVDMDMKSARREAPYFAYLQTSHGNTAKSKTVGIFSEEQGGDQGYRVFVYALDDNVLQVLGDIAKGTNMSIGFNRSQGGLDVLVPIDLRVAKSAIGNAGMVSRHQSDHMLMEFVTCVSDVTKELSSPVGHP